MQGQNYSFDPPLFSNAVINFIEPRIRKFGGFFKIRQIFATSDTNGQVICIYYVCLVSIARNMSQRDGDLEGNFAPERYSINNINMKIKKLWFGSRDC